MANIYYHRTDEFWRKEQKYDFLEARRHRARLDWRPVAPNKRHTWLTEGLQAEFHDFLPIGTKKAKAGRGDAIFKNYGRGVATTRDAWTYNFIRDELVKNIQRMIESYNEHVYRWGLLDQKPKIDDFVLADNTKINWSEGLKAALKRQITVEFSETIVRSSIYRPFTRKFLYFDKYLCERRYQMPSIFPTSTTEAENLAICVAGIGNRKGFGCLMVNSITALDLAFEKSQCFPFYTYDEDGSNRRENITDWALAQFREHYQSQIVNPKSKIEKWDIFHYIYALLHHPTYRETYAANLRRELPRIPFAEQFWPFAEAGARLAELHVNYERQDEYPLEFIENPDEPLNWRVEKMRLSKDKTKLKYNNFLTLAGIPPEVFNYRLGNRSALDWVIDQYRVKTDKRSGIVNDPNNLDDEQYIVRLIGQVITVSLETVKIVEGLPELNLEGAATQSDDDN